MPAGSARRTCDAEAAAVPEVRKFVRTVLADTVDPDLAAATELVVSELVGNVVLHVGGVFTVAVTFTDDEVVLEVTDASEVVPSVSRFSSSANTGRGLRLIQSLCADFDVRREAGSKTVSARLTHDSTTRSTDEMIAAYDDSEWSDPLADTAPEGPMAAAAGPRAA